MIKSTEETEKLPITDQADSRENSPTPTAIPTSSIEIHEVTAEIIAPEAEEDEPPVVKIKKWVVQRYENLPHWLKDNEFLLTGHRPPLPSFRDCLKSIFSIHSETGNIWTHLLGCLAFFVLAVWFLTRVKEDITLQEKIVFSFFFGGAILCLGLSFLYHTFICHSPNVSSVFRKLDYAGITLLTIGSFIPYVYYSFYCRQEPKVIYISMIGIFGTAAFTVSMMDRFGQVEYRAVRASVFVIMGLSGVIPAVHLMITDGIKTLITEMSFIFLVIMAVLYIFGAGLYGFRFPEKYFPGKFDLWCQSHQLLHICVIVAAFTHYYGIQKLAHLRLTQRCN